MSADPDREARKAAWRAKVEQARATARLFGGRPLTPGYPASIAGGRRDRPTLSPLDVQKAELRRAEVLATVSEADARKICNPRGLARLAWFWKFRGATRAGSEIVAFLDRAAALKEAGDEAGLDKLKIDWLL